MASKQRRAPVSIDLKRLASYGIAGATAATCGMEAANAGITYTVVNRDMLDTTLSDPAEQVAFNLTFTPTGGGANWNFALGHGIGTINAATGYASVGDILGLGNAVQHSGFAAAGYNYVNKIAPNTVINSLTDFRNVLGSLAYNMGGGNDKFLDSGPGFIGVRFNTNQFGWVRVNMNGAPLNSFRIVDYAYADAGESIFAGQITAVPEVSSLGLLAMGAAGILAWRRRRAANPSTAA
jgi:hypothetical protein